MQRIQSIHERLQRWAVWHFTARVRGQVATSRWDVDPVDRAVYGPGTLISAGDEEALVTEQAVGSLAIEHADRGRRLQRSVREVYLQREGRSMENTAAILRVTARTLHNHLCDADRLISAWLVRYAKGRATAALRDEGHAPHYRRALYAPAVD